MAGQRSNLPKVIQAGRRPRTTQALWLQAPFQSLPCSVVLPVSPVCEPNSKHTWLKYSSSKTDGKPSVTIPSMLLSSNTNLFLGDGAGLWASMQDRRCSLVPGFPAWSSPTPGDLRFTPSCCAKQGLRPPWHQGCHRSPRSSCTREAAFSPAHVPTAEGPITPSWGIFLFLLKLSFSPLQFSKHQTFDPLPHQTNPA